MSAAAITQRLLLAAAFVLLLLTALCLAGCQTMETITTTTNPSGVQTTIIKRPVTDPFDAMFPESALELMRGGFER